MTLESEIERHIWDAVRKAIDDPPYYRPDRVSCSCDYLRGVLRTTDEQSLELTRIHTAIARWRDGQAKLMPLALKRLLPSEI